MKFMYKCRMCGETFGYLCAPDEMVLSVLTALQMREFAASEFTNRGFIVTKTDTHFCDGHESPLKRVGVADLIGAQAE